MVITPDDLGHVVDRVRMQEPLVQCITNVVVSNFTANALLAMGASAAMADLPGEAGDFAKIANGLLVNLGTPYAEQRIGMLEAVAGAQLAGTPWVLDPVAVGGLAVRTAMVAPLLASQPTVIRGNASEIGYCAGVGQGGRGVDATVGVDEIAERAAAFAREQHAVVAISGPVDVILAPDGRQARIHNGSPWLTKVTGGGCALGAVIAACAGSVEDPFVATVAAHAWWGVAAQRAEGMCAGPASFAVAHLDHVAQLSGENLSRECTLSF